MVHCFYHYFAAVSDIGEPVSGGELASGASL